MIGTMLFCTLCGTRGIVLAMLLGLPGTMRNLLQGNTGRPSRVLHDVLGRMFPKILGRVGSVQKVIAAVLGKMLRAPSS